MTANDFETLHDKFEPRLPTGQLISMLDVMGACITCDQCGRWQRLGTLSLDEGRKKAAVSGWTEGDGKDLCRICTASVA